MTEVTEATREAEAAFLADMFFVQLDGKVLIDEARFIVELDDFMYKGNRHYRIYQAMLQAPHTDPITVAQTMHRLGILQGGDCAYMSEILANCCTPYDWEYHAKAVKHYSELRQGKKPTKTKGIEL